MHKQSLIKAFPGNVISRAPPQPSAAHAHALQVLAVRLHRRLTIRPSAMLIKPSELTRIFKALANAHRLTIVEQLSSGPASVTELASVLPITEPAVVHHLQRLEASGLVQSEKEGRVRICCLDPEKLRIAEDWIADKRKTLRRRPLYSKGAC